MDGLSRQAPQDPQPSQDPAAPARELRSARWFGEGGTGGHLRTFSHRSRMRQLGYLPEEHLGKPVIGILNTWSDINPCHMHLRERAEWQPPEPRFVRGYGSL